jgi:hypothetical protein
VQLYVRKINCYDNKPYKQLAGFKKVWLEAGETQTVEISVPLRELKFWNYVHGRYMVESGDYRVWFGRSSGEDDVIASAVIKISGLWKAPLSAVTLRCIKAAERRRGSRLCLSAVADGRLSSRRRRSSL